MVRIAGLWSVQHCVDTLLWKGGIYRAQVCLWYNADVGDSLNSHKSKPQLLKRKWSEDMTRNVQQKRPARAKVRARKRAKAALAKSRPKIAKAVKVLLC